jgi:hypothetical protein
VQEQQANQEESFFELMKMVSSVIGELKEEINLEKQTRQENKNKMTTLFSQACSKFSG